MEVVLTDERILNTLMMALTAGMEFGPTNNSKPLVIKMTILFFLEEDSGGYSSRKKIQQQLYDVWSHSLSHSLLLSLSISDIL